MSDFLYFFRWPYLSHDKMIFSYWSPSYGILNLYLSFIFYCYFFFFWFSIHSVDLPKFYQSKVENNSSISSREGGIWTDRYTVPWNHIKPFLTLFNLKISGHLLCCEWLNSSLVQQIFVFTIFLVNFEKIFSVEPYRMYCHKNSSKTPYQP